MAEVRAQIGLYSVSKVRFWPSASHVLDIHKQSENKTYYYATFKPISILNGPTHWNKGLTSIGILEFNLLTTSVPMLTDVTWEGATRPTRTHCLIATGLLIVGFLCVNFMGFSIHRLCPDKTSAD
jgi:hypothetical protein